MTKKICFISSFFNHAGFQRPVINCYNFLKYTVQHAFPLQDFYFGQIEENAWMDAKGLINKSNYMGFKSKSPLWHKERILNLLVREFELTERYEYICWVDCDIFFRKPVEIPYDCELVAFQPFKYSYRSKVPRTITPNFHWDGDKFESYGYNRKGDKGLSWVIRSDYLDEIGGFFDYGIVGGGDTFTNYRLIGEKFFTGCPGLDREINEYIETSLKSKEIGYLDNEVYHCWHGRTSDRQYGDRIKILRKHDFDPLRDLKIAKNGLYYLDNEEFNADIMEFFKNRKEDG